MARTGVTDDDLAAIAAERRAAGALNPEAQVRQAASAAELRATPWAVQPLRQGSLRLFDHPAARDVLNHPLHADQHSA